MKWKVARKYEKSYGKESSEFIKAFKKYLDHLDKILFRKNIYLDTDNLKIIFENLLGFLPYERGMTKMDKPGQTWTNQDKPPKT